MNILPGRKAVAAPPVEKPRPSVALARQAAEIEQRVINLQDECENWRQQALAWENAARLAEGERDQVKAENHVIRRENEELRARHVRIDERIAQSASLVLSCAELLRGVKEGPAAYAPKDPEVRRLEAATDATRTIAAELGLPPDSGEGGTDSEPPPTAPRPPKAA